MHSALFMIRRHVVFLSLKPTFMRVACHGLTLKKNFCRHKRVEVCYIAAKSKGVCQQMKRFRWVDKTGEEND